MSTYARVCDVAVSRGPVAQAAFGLALLLAGALPTLHAAHPLHPVFDAQSDRRVASEAQEAASQSQPDASRDEDYLDYLLRLADQESARPQALPAPTRIAAAVVSPDGKHVAGIAQSGDWYLWDAGTGQLVRQFTAPKPLFPEFFPVALLDAERMLVGSAEGDVALCSTGDGRARRLLGKHDGAVHLLAVGPAGRHAATFGADGMLYVWDVFEGKQLSNYNLERRHATDLAIFEQGRSVLVAQRPQGVSRFDVERGVFVGGSGTSNVLPTALAVAPSDDWFAVGRADGKIHLVSFRRDGPHGIISTDLKAVQSLAFSAGGTELVAHGAVAAERYRIQSRARMDHVEVPATRGTLLSLAPGGQNGLYVAEDGSLSLLPVYLAEPMSFDEALAQLYLGEEFDALDEYAAWLRREGVKLASGDPLLDPFYLGLTPPRDLADDQYAQLFERIERWIEHNPKSPTAYMILACTYREYAWKARGSGAAFTVGRKQWELFQERIAKMREALQRAEQLAQDDPELYSQMIHVGKCESWDRQEVQRAFDKAVALEPAYYPAYLEMAAYLLPRWHGQPGDLEQFAEQSARRLGGAVGDELYVRIAMAMAYYYRKTIFIDTQLSYDRLRPAVRVLYEQETTTPRRRELLAYLAWAARDLETSRLMLPLLEPRQPARPWNGQEFAVFRTWADPKRPTPESSHTVWTSSPSVRWISLAPDASTVIVPSSDAVTPPRLLELPSGRERRDLEILTPITSVAVYRPDGAAIATSGALQRGAVLLWDLEHGGEPKALNAHRGHVLAVAFSSDSRRLAISGDDRRVTVWDLEQRRRLHTFAQNPPARWLVFSDAGRTLVAADQRGTVRRWELPSGKLAATLDARQGFSEFTITSNGALAAAAVNDAVQIWDLRAGMLQRTIPLANIPVTALVLSPDDKRLVVGTAQAKILFFSMENGKLVRTLNGHWAAVSDLAFSADGATLVSGGNDGTVQIWEVAKLLP